MEADKSKPSSEGHSKMATCYLMMVSQAKSKEEMNMYAVLEHGMITMVFPTYDEACEYLDNVALGWDSSMGLFDVGIIPYDEEV